MKKELIKLQEKRSQKMKAANAIITKMESGEEELTEEEKKELDELSDEVDEMDEEIERMQKAINMRAKNRMAAFKSEETKVRRSYNILRALELAARNKPLDGVELEMHQQAVAEARVNGHSIKGIGVPAMLSEKRSVTVGSATAAGDAVATMTSDIYDALAPKLNMEQMGVELLTGLVGDLDVIVGDGDPSFLWEGETDNNTLTNPTVKKETLSPNRLSGTVPISMQWLAQTSQQAQNYVTNRIVYSEQKAVELAILNGADAGGEPGGILEHSDLNTVAIGTNGGVPTHAALEDMQTQVAVDNGDLTKMGYIVTPEIRGLLKTTKIDAGSGIFIWDKGVANELLGYQAMVSNLLPKTLVKGTSGANCHALIFGDYSQILVGNWGTRDLIVDPYTGARTGQINIHVNSFWDVVIKHGQSFSAIVDALLS